jgi:hypothetical protein
MLVLATGCASVQGSDKDEKQAFILGSVSEMMVELYDENPELEQEVENAVGWAAFNYRLTKLPVILTGIGGGGGYGLAVDNRTGEKTYMSVQMGEWGVGMGTRVFGTIFVFEDKKVMQDFVRKGWEFGSAAEVTAKTSEGSGVAASGGVSTTHGMKVYHVTREGIAYGVSFRGTKYTTSKSLN